MLPSKMPSPKSFEIIKKLGFDLLIQNKKVYLESEDVRVFLLQLNDEDRMWQKIDEELLRWDFQVLSQPTI